MPRAIGSRPQSLADAAAIPALLILCAGFLFWDLLLARSMAGPLHMNDFGRFYDSGRAFLENRDLYAPGPTALLQVGAATGVQFLNLNPPHFLLLIVPLALLPPADALTIWMGLNIFAFALSVLLIARELGLAWNPRRLLAVGAGTLAFAGTQAFFVTGQLSMLVLLAMTLSWIDARRGRWNTAGVWLGLAMSLKLFLLIFVPYLLPAGRRVALITALATAGLVTALGWLVFGAGAYTSWIHALGKSNSWAWAAMNASAFGLFRRTFGVSPYYAPAAIVPGLVPAWLGVAGLVGIVTLWTVAVDRTPWRTDRAFGLLLAASQLISPLGWIYYLCLPAGPVAALALRQKGADLSGGSTALQVREEGGPEGLHYTLGRSRGRWRTVLGGIAVAGFLLPTGLLLVGQPHAWATPLVGSAYFWATLALWLWLLLDVPTAPQTRIAPC